MSENYSLIKDEEETKRFIEKVLQPLKNDEVYITVLTARKKYCPTISSSMEVVTRDIIRNNDTNKILRKLKKMSIVEGLYTDKNEDIIPNEAFALYILPEPRSMLKAYNEFTKNINEWNYENLVKSNIVEGANLELYRKLDLKLFSSIHKSKSKSKYFIIDIDKKDETLLNNTLDRIKMGDLSKDLGSSLQWQHPSIESISWISETRGGWHIILNRNEMTGKFIHELQTKYSYLLKDSEVEIRKETMTPVVGTSQGGFVVKEYRLCM